jgi:hypothetical protein
MPVERVLRQISFRLYFILNFGAQSSNGFSAGSLIRCQPLPLPNRLHLIHFRGSIFPAVLQIISKQSLDWNCVKKGTRKVRGAG